MTCSKKQANSQPTTINGLERGSKSQQQQQQQQTQEHNQKQTQKKMVNSSGTTNSGNELASRGRATVAAGWKVKASDGALNTSNPIREIIETMNLAENPDKKVIPLSIGDPTIFSNLKPCKEILDAIQKANVSGKYYGYQTAAGMEAAREAVAEYHYKCTGNRLRLQVSP